MRSGAATPPEASPHATGPRTRFVVLPDASALLIATRSSVGPIEFATTSLTGSAQVALDGHALHPSAPSSAQLALPVDSLTSGNTLYDAQVRSRLDSRLYPTIELALRGSRALEGSRWALEGDLTIHGTTRTMAGTADIREFAIELPSALMLRIFPEVTVRFHLEAVREA